MTVETWLAFVAASLVLLVIPGPTVLLAVSYALGQGRRAVLPLALGVALADLTAMLFSMLGVGMLLNASPMLFCAVKWAGAAYLAWLGVKLWRAGGTLQATPREGRASAIAMAVHVWIVTCLNPKGIIFFVAFLPQFLNPAGDFLRQMSILIVTFVTLSFVNSTAWALAGAQARRLVQSERAMGAVNKVGGAFLIGAALIAASAHQA
jgi:threonine/homoserine/homoserine lactone efflux protein